MKALLAGAKFTPEQIKLTCNWDKAIYKEKWNDEKETLDTEPDNTNFIEELKKDTTSDPQKIPDDYCSRWSR